MVEESNKLLPRGEDKDNASCMHKGDKETDTRKYDSGKQDGLEQLSGEGCDQSRVYPPQMGARENQVHIAETLELSSSHRLFKWAGQLMLPLLPPGYVMPDRKGGRSFIGRVIEHLGDDEKGRGRTIPEKLLNTSGTNF